MTAPDEVGLSNALDTLRQIDGRACAALLDHHAVQLSYLVEWLGDMEERPTVCCRSTCRIADRRVSAETLSTTGRDFSLEG